MGGYLLAFLIFLTVSICPAVIAQSNDQAEKISDERSFSGGLVVDTSGTMRLKMDLVISMLRSFIELNGTDDEVFLITFTDANNINVRQEMTTNKDELEDEIENIFVQPGRTAIVDALWAAAAYLSGSSQNGKERYLILVSDGDERGSRIKLSDLVGKLKSENIPVYIVGIAEQKVETRLLEKIARESGGRLFLPLARSEVLETAKRIRQEMRSR